VVIGNSLEVYFDLLMMDVEEVIAEVGDGED